MLFAMMASPDHIEACIRTLLSERSMEASICPSEVARALWPAHAWRAHMDEVRNTALRMHSQGQLLITQKGQPIDPQRIRGPIRLKRPS